VAVERLGDRIAVASLAVFDQRRGADDDARDAEAALHAAFEHERVGDDPAGLVRNAVERHDLMPVHLLRLAQARERRASVDHHQTAAAGAFRGAAVLGRGDAAFLPQHLQQVHAGLIGGFGRVSVEGKPKNRH
jgi:hypothetical protein